MLFYRLGNNNQTDQEDETKGLDQRSCEGGMGGEQRLVLRVKEP
jgi:hypothetical protein